MQALRMLFASLAIAGASASASAQWYEPYPERNAYGSREVRVRNASLGDYFAPQREYATNTRALVNDPTGQRAGTITVDTRRRALYLSLGGGQAIRYGVGVGREGFRWRGAAYVGRKAAWPSWRPPAAMLKRRPDLPRFMEGGIENPLGARALYLFQGSKDTLFRIHGTNEPWTIGEAVSSGCIRMMNADVVDLYQRVRVGARVVVL